MNTVVIIQTRMSSTRLPGKVLYPLNKRPVLEHVVNRVKQAKLVDDVVVATTDLTADDIIVQWTEALGIKYYRGSESNVLERYYQAALASNAKTVIRITSDCPLIDPKLIDLMVEFYRQNNFRMVTNSGPYDDKRTYPRGLDIEILDFELLKEAHYDAKEDYEREHVTPYVYKNFNENIYHFLNSRDMSNYRWTLDTIEDFKFIQKVYEYFGSEISFADTENILSFLESNNEIREINQNIQQKKVPY